ncbi:hypothetical protein Tdes44962_MAKER09411 [Teratosphaeria destructans]|uniref:Uncharacterized protein n=1 Tax=Teratosphaeria destructans TaxID=418781 RepID=A0A9W7ST12_9PEZI|nr:hypothetical protein Tdes44962_MAKER09411 [Teratosphaeria destructans]
MYTSLLTTLALLGSAAAAPQWDGSGSWSGHGSSGATSGSKGACSEAVVALATGIHLNIQGQYGEFNSTKKILAIESSTPVNMTAFYIAKGQLLANVQTGMNLRQFNQEIAPAGNPALPGLAKYQAAEEVEKMLAESFTGVPSHDMANLNYLLSNITTGIQLNENNLKNATSVCDFTLQFPAADQSGS